jgi:ABC-type multidrug transport system fused ATPase/permease subunit
MKIFIQIIDNLDSNEYKKSLKIFLLIAAISLLDILSIGMFFPIISLLIKKDFYLNFNNFIILSEFSDKELIYFLLILIVSIFLLKNIVYLYFSYEKKKLLADLSNNFTARTMFFNLHQNYLFFLKKSNSELIRDSGLINEYVLVIENFINLFIEFVILFFIFALILYTNLVVGISIVGCSMTLYFFTTYFLRSKLNKYGKLINIYSNDLIKNYLNTYGSIRDLILRKKQFFFVNRFKQIIQKNSMVNVRSTFLMELPKYIIEILIVFFISLIIFFFITTNKSQEEILIQIGFFVALVFRAMPSVSRVIYLSGNLNLKIDTLKLVNEIILNIKNKTKTKPNKKQIIFNKIKFENVFFKYSDDSEYVLKNINFLIKKNETIGLIGRSGSGKSTILDLLSGLLTPDKGKIILNDNKNIKNFIDSWQLQISYISQKNFLLNTSIQNNIAFGENEKEINYNKIEQCLLQSNLKNFVNSLAEGLNYNVGENGKNLSGGQRQRIIIARALYQKSNVIIFDEATSALDKKTESLIMKDIEKNLHGKKTLIICTHNIRLLKFCKNILMIKKGSIVKIR